jgi:uncharacterized membrane protein
VLDAAVVTPAPAAAEVAAPAPPPRNRSIDLVRGVVMALMVLDHARDFFFASEIDPTDILRAPPILFLTRWVTHFCAPGFVLLAGAAAYLYGRKRSASELRRFLLTRGLWLIVLEVTVVRFGWLRDLTYGFTFLQVIWAIGWSMVLLAPLSSLPPRVLAAIGAAIIVLHNALDGIEATSFGGFRFLWAVLHDPSRFEPFQDRVVYVAYPLIPWVGVIALGFGVGALFARPIAERRRALLAIGVGLSIAFAVLRGINAYGNPLPWGEHPEPIRTLMSFLNCEKYPPSLDYLLMTLGPIFVLLGLLESWTPPAWIARPFDVFGRVPLFFYVGHLYLVSLGGMFLAYARWGPLAMDPDGHDGNPGLPLWGLYLTWIVVLAILYPACRWFAGLKERRGKDWWWLAYV